MDDADLHSAAKGLPLSKSDARRLKTLLALVDDHGNLNLHRALTELYGEQDYDIEPARGKAQNELRKFRQRVAAAAKTAQIPFAIETGGETRTEPSKRTLTVTLAPNKPLDLEAAARTAIASAGDPAPMSLLQSVSAAVSGGAIVAPSGRPLNEGRPRVTVFLVYAKQHIAAKDRLIDRLDSRKYRFKFLPLGIEAKQNWQHSGAEFLESSDLRLILLSPTVIAHSFLSKPEVVAILRQKRTLAVELLPVDETRLKTLDASWLFQPSTRFAFEVWKRDSEGQMDFAAALTARIEELLVPLPADVVQAAVLAADPECLPPDLLELARRAAEDPQLKAYVGSKYQIFDMRNLALRRDSIAPISSADYREDALDYILKWLRDPAASPWFALLGELGMGKTTACKALARRILELRDAGESLPSPVYLDLRALGAAARDRLTLEDVVNRILSLNWKTGPGAPQPTARDIFALVTNPKGPGALIIFDGLDEVLVHLDTQSGQEFTRLLYSILPPARPDHTPLPSRLIVSCRTHYFRSLPEQKLHFLAQGREDVGPHQYSGLLLLPFNEEQIREYVRQTLPALDPAGVDRVMETIASVHNLRELAERPLTLSYIAAEIEGIERWKAEGRRVTGVTLYRHMVESWLLRDAGKHQFRREDKQALMESLAAGLWQSGEKTWPIDRLERWLAAYLKSNPDLAAHCTNKLARDGRREDPLELLKEDLRAATFLVREDSESSAGRFRFAHTSLQEYFLAGYLRRALIDGDLARWQMPAPSRETLDFLGQWLLEDESESPAECRGALRGIESLRNTHRPDATRLAFAYVLLARKRRYPAPAAAGFQLPGEDLSEWEIEGSPDSPLALAKANFQNTNLRNVLFRYCNLEAADFSGALAERAEFLSSYLARTQWRDAALEGATFRDSNLAGADLDGGHRNRTWIVPGRQTKAPNFAPTLAPRGGHTSLVSGCAWSPDGSRVLSASSDNTLRIWDAASAQSLLTLQGHTAYVTGCAWSPDGSRVLSASSDRTLRIWDAASGQSLLTLQGHTESVFGCAWSPDGPRVLSASSDNTLRIWDATSGQSLLTLQGHTESVSGCAWSPDGSRVLSASYDNTLRIWDAASGQSLLTLQGHTESVSGCAWSPDGPRVLSASSDNTLRIWDATSGQSLLTLQGHTESVSGCAWSPDGSRVLSASHDNTLRIWDAASAQSLLTLQGHTESVSGCAWSPDGSRVLSASDDNTLRIWDTASGQSLLTLQGHTSLALGCAWSPDGSRVLSASYDNTLRIWDAASGQSLLTLQGHTSLALGCAWSPDGSRVLSASYDNTLRIWDAASAQSLLTLQGHTGSVNGCAWSPDGSRVLSASYDKTLRIWDAASGQSLLTLQGHTGSVNGCAWSPDGSRVLSASYDNTLRIWDAASGQSLLTLQGHANYVRSCAWSPDGSRVLSASDDNTLRIWDTASGQSLLTLQGHTGSVNGCAWSPDGSRVLSASSDKTLRIWDAASGQPLLALQGHTNSVWGCAWSPDGSRVLSASLDGTLRTWDAATGRELTRSAVYTHPHSESPGRTDWLTLDVPNNRVLAKSRDAWRHLGWIAQGTPGHTPEWFPYEYFPESERDSPRPPAPSDRSHWATELPAR